MNDYLEKKLKARRYGQEKGMLYKSYTQTTGDGLEIGLAPVFGALLGYWLQKHFAIAPYGVVLGLLFGIAHATKIVLKLKKRIDQA